MSHSSPNICPRCGTPLRPGAHFCPKCGEAIAAGAPVPEAPRRASSSQWTWILGGAGLAVLLVAILGIIWVLFQPNTSRELSPITYVLVTPATVTEIAQSTEPPTAEATAPIVAIPTLAPLPTQTPTSPPVATSAPTPTFTLPPATLACTNNAAFVADVSIPDGTVLSPGQAFVKTWRLKNTGSCTWDTSYAFAFTGGEQMSASSPQAVAVAAPNATVDISVSMIAPTAPGSHAGQWQMRASNGSLFGGTMTVVVNVPSPVTSTPTNTIPPSPCSGTPNIPSFAASASTITAGTSTTLSWGSVTNATSLSLEPGIGGVEMAGSRVVSPATTTTYTLTAVCSANGATTIKTVTVTVNPSVCSGTPNIPSFTASPSTIIAGNSTTLAWDLVTNATSVTLDPGGVGVTTPNSMVVAPPSTTTYTLTAVCSANGATAQKSVTVTVNAGPPPAPGQVSPAGGTVLTNSPRTATFTWNPVSYAGGVTYNIEIQWNNTTSWQNFTTQTGLSGTSYTMPAFPGDNQGRWRVWSTSPTAGNGPKSGWWTFSFNTAPVVHSSGSLDIGASYLADLDAGVISIAGGDIWYHAVNATTRYLEPANGATMAKVSGSVGKNGCMSAPLSSSPINFTNLPVGTYVCVHTNEGRYSQFRVNALFGPAPSTLRIGYTTWE